MVSRFGIFSVFANGFFFIVFSFRFWFRAVSLYGAQAAEQTKWDFEVSKFDAVWGEGALAHENAKTKVNLMTVLSRIGHNWQEK